MENKPIFIGLLFALLQATSGKGAEPALLSDDVPLNIYIDGGKEIDSFLSLAKKIENTQSRIEATLERMSAEIKTMAERISTETKATEDKLNQRMTTEAKATEDRLNQRMSAEIKAIKEDWNEKMSEMSNQQTQRISGEVPLLNQTVNELSNQLRKSSEVATPNKRPAERACEEIKKDLRSSGLTNITNVPNSYLWLYTSNKAFLKHCCGALIDKRFVLTSSECLTTHQFVKIQFSYSVLKGIKALHKHPDYSSETASLHNIGLIELDSDVDYTHDLYPVCLYTTQSIPKNLKIRYTKVQIVADTECGKENNSTKVCVKNTESVFIYPAEPIYVEETEFPKLKLFGIFGQEYYDGKPYLIEKIFDHLEFIESIVWPKNDY